MTTEKRARDGASHLTSLTPKDAEKTLRDEFAMAALSPLIGLTTRKDAADPDWATALATLAYTVAAAMLKVRALQQQDTRQ